MTILASRRSAVAAAACRSLRLAALLLLVVPGCGDDDGEAVLDAAPVVDTAEASSDGGTTSPYEMLVCEAAVDAGLVTDAEAAPADAAPLADAAAGLADATPPGDGGLPGLDEPCCDPTGPCPSGLACLSGSALSGPRCRPICNYPGGDCGPGGICGQFGTTGICIPAAREGEPCSPELCDGLTLCVGSSAEEAVCRRRCTETTECEAGQTCTAVSGTSSGAKACL